MTDPGIKGTLFEAVAEDLERVIEEGRITREELESKTRPEDLALLDEKVSAVRWYDIHAYHRLVAVLCDAEGGGQESYWFTRGERAADRLEAKGIYQQLEYLGRTSAARESDPEARFKAFAKDMRLLMTLHAAMLNFGEWKCLVDPDHPDRYRVEISQIEGVPDGIFMAAAGMFSALSRMSRGQGAFSWIYQRARPDLAIIRMTGPV
jgi:hypothetical protein